MLRYLDIDRRMAKAQRKVAVVSSTGGENAASSSTPAASSSTPAGTAAGNAAAGESSPRRLRSLTAGAARNVLTAMLSATLIASILNYVWFEPHRNDREWKQAALERVISPVNMNLRRSTLAYEQYRSKHLYFQAQILFDTNKQVRDLLLAQSHLLPNELREHAACLIAHYDMWMLRYQLTLQSREWKPSDHFEMAYHNISDGPCSQFPVAARDRFRAVEDAWRHELGHE